MTSAAEFVGSEWPPAVEKTCVESRSLGDVLAAGSLVGVPSEVPLELSLLSPVDEGAGAQVEGPSRPVESSWSDGASVLPLVAISLVASEVLVAGASDVVSTLGIDVARSSVVASSSSDTVSSSVTCTGAVELCSWGGSAVCERSPASSTAASGSFWAGDPPSSPQPTNHSTHPNAPTRRIFIGQSTAQLGTK